MKHNTLYYRTVDSTFLELERLHTIAPNSCYAIRADEQTSGIGRKQTHWSSPPGGLWYSFDLVFPKSVESFALYIGACIHRTLLGLFPALGGELTIKWPNDIYFRDRKLAGILTRHYHHRNLYLIGLGLNVNNEQMNNQDLRAISLREIIGEEVSISYMAELITRNVVSWLDELEEPGRYLNYCADNLYGKGRDCIVDQGEYQEKGKIQGLDKQGNLLLDGEREVNYGSLTVL